MTIQSTTRRMLLAVAFVSLCLPVIAAAQGGYDPWGRGRRDERRDDDYRRGGRRRDDDYRRRDEYGRRSLRDTVRRVKDASKDFQKEIDRALDRGRYDDTRLEDRINEVVKDFRKAAENLDGRVDDNRDLNRSATEARRLLELGGRIDRAMTRGRIDSRITNDWSRIRQDLQTIADVYGLRFSSYGGDDGYRRGRYDPRADNRPWWLPRF